MFEGKDMERKILVARDTKAKSCKDAVQCPGCGVVGKLITLTAYKLTIEGCRCNKGPR